MVFATREGGVTKDGKGRNSPFAAALLKHIGKAGQRIDDLFKDVRNEVKTATGAQQEPYRVGDTAGTFYFNPPGIETAEDTTVQTPPPLRKIAQLLGLKPTKVIAAVETQDRIEAVAAADMIEASLPGEVFVATEPDEIFVATEPDEIFVATEPDEVFVATAPADAVASLQPRNWITGTEIQWPEAATPPLVARALEVVAYSGEGSPKSISGSWNEVGAARLRVEVPDAKIHAELGRDAALTSDGKGNWTLTLAQPLASGSHDVSVTVMAKDGGSDHDTSANEIIVKAPEQGPAFNLFPQIARAGGLQRQITNTANLPAIHAAEPGTLTGRLIEIASIASDLGGLAIVPPKSPAANGIDGDSVPDPAQPDLAMELQRKLQALGCLGNAPDGRWGKSSNDALGKYAKIKGLAIESLDPSQDTLSQLNAESAAVCVADASPIKTPAPKIQVAKPARVKPVPARPLPVKTVPVKPVTQPKPTGTKKPPVMIIGPG